MAESKTAIRILGPPIERVLSLYSERQGEIEERGWNLADIYLELSGGGPTSSDLHGRFAEFFNGQARAVLAGGEHESKLEYWAGTPERGAALRDEVLEILRQDDNRAAAGAGSVEVAGDAAPARPDPRTRALILAHNQIDVELHAHFAGMLERDRPPPRRPAAPPRSTAVCMLGMSRSGTSVTARILNVLGVDLGAEEELMEPASGNNPAGFWEHKAIADLNEDILATLGDAPRQRWRHPPPLPKDWQDDPRLEPHRRAARSILRESFAGTPLWGWKDPRTCLTLPFWRQLLAETPEVGADLRYVICVRHPDDVAASLRARDEMEREESLLLWHRYMSDALLHTSGQPRLFVAYESYFGGLEEQATRLAGFIDLPSPSAAQRAEIAAHLDERLWHQRKAAEGKPAASLPPEVADLYAMLADLTAQP